MSHVEMIVWHRPEDSMPDDDTTVLIVTAGDDSEVLLGYADGGDWREADGYKLAGATWWAHLPEGPTEQGIKA